MYSQKQLSKTYDLRDIELYINEKEYCTTVIYSNEFMDESESDNISDSE